MQSVISPRPWPWAISLGLLASCSPTLLSEGGSRAISAGSDRFDPGVAAGTDPQQAKIDLGRRMMFDLRLSKPDGVSCGMCHDPQFGWGDRRPQGKGVQDNTLDSAGHDGELAVEGNRYKTFLTPRNTPTVYNSHIFPNLFWDLRAGDLQHQAVFPFEAGPEMNSSWTDHILPILRTEQRYQAMFADAYGEVELSGATWDEATLRLTEAGAFADYDAVADDELTITGGIGTKAGTYSVVAKISDDTVELAETIGPGADGQGDTTGAIQLITRIRGGDAIGTYEETISVFDTPYDAFVAGDMNALTAQEKEGHDLFFEEVGNGGAGCFECHPAPDLSDLMAHNIGVPTAGRFALEGVTDLGFGVRTDLTQTPPVQFDEPTDYAKFKTPQLRMTAVTGPYMHNGAFSTLEEVIDFYDQGGGPDLSGTGTKDPLIQPLNLTQQEKDALLAFVRDGLMGTEIK